MDVRNSTVAAAMAISTAYRRGRDDATIVEKPLELNTKLTDVLEDSLDYLEFFMFLEEEWPSAKFSDNEVADMKDITVSGLVDKMLAKGA